MKSGMHSRRKSAAISAYQSRSSSRGRTCPRFFRAAVVISLAFHDISFAFASSCEIEAWNGGGAAVMSKVTVKNGELAYDAGDFESRRAGPAKRRPTEEEWQAFESAMREIDIWHWEPRHSTSSAVGCSSSRSARS